MKAGDFQSHGTEICGLRSYLEGSLAIPELQGQVHPHHDVLYTHFTVPH